MERNDAEAEAAVSRRDAMGTVGFDDAEIPAFSGNCPVDCPMCAAGRTVARSDAAAWFAGAIWRDEAFADNVSSRWPDLLAIPREGALRCLARKMIEDANANVTLQAVATSWFDVPSKVNKAQTLATVINTLRRGTFQDLFTAEEIVTRSSSEPPGRSHDATFRAGVLVSPALLSSAKGYLNRGVLVRRVFLCEEPPPSPGLGGTLSPQGTGMSMRSWYETFLKSSPKCSTCHEPYDGIGFSLAVFDGNGQVVSSDAWGEPIKTDASIPLDGQLAYFVDVEGLGAAMAQSRAARDCLNNKITASVFGARAAAAPPIETFSPATRLREVLAERFVARFRTEGGLQ